MIDGNGGSGVTLEPGAALVEPMLDLEQPDDFGNDIYFQYNKVYGPHAGVAWTDETYTVDGCAGYAQARSFVLADVETPKARSTIMLWGQPFSLGWRSGPASRDQGDDPAQCGHACRGEHARLPGTRGHQHRRPGRGGQRQRFEFEQRPARARHVHRAGPAGET
ncbi:hypothetical protein EBN03_27420 [Nocardia stercoris]|uniref:Uncharacterized protein n=1 Tax=Nocardia stercoris TaxID=2483361 RepID=A0A3M2KVE3_9NOCA|nr:hypothetical protein EBN03_27420 [Nocardia stercoris]